MRASLLLIPFAVVAQDRRNTARFTVLLQTEAARLFPTFKSVFTIHAGAVSGVDGRFRITAVRPGRYQLRVTLDGIYAATTSVEVRAGLEHNVDIPTAEARWRGRQSVTVSDSFFVPPEEVKSPNFSFNRKKSSRQRGHRRMS